MKSVITEIATQNNLNLIEFTPLSGGDINAVFRLNCEEGDFAAKLNITSAFPEMFNTEAKGLQLLKSSNSFRIPNVIAIGGIGKTPYLLMEYISENRSKTNFWEAFAQNLSSLHQNTQHNFGLDYDNYIGSLPQQNNNCRTASEFYISQRLEPQFKTATDNGFYFHNLEQCLKNISGEIPNEPPALIHGDLWSGNYLVSENGNPVLIDPAISFASREMDLAMMQLFGGFPEEVFVCYHSFFPLKDGWKSRVQLWQLYYLLVHLNLFGSGYLASVESIVANYS